MPSNSIEYNKKNYSRFWGQPAQIKARALRNKARAIMIKKGIINKGSKLEIDHINWTAKWNWDGNLRAISQRKNRILGQIKATRARIKNRNANK